MSAGRAAGKGDVGDICLKDKEEKNDPAAIRTMDPSRFCYH